MVAVLQTKPRKVEALRQSSRRARPLETGGFGIPARPIAGLQKQPPTPPLKGPREQLSPKAGFSGFLPLLGVRPNLLREMCSCPIERDERTERGVLEFCPTETTFCSPTPIPFSSNEPSILHEGKGSCTKMCRSPSHLRIAISSPASVSLPVKREVRADVIKS